MNKKPKVMFSNFKNNWKNFSFYNLANVFQSGGTPSTKELTFWGGTIPWIQSSDIQKDILFGVIPQKFISEEGLQNSSAKLIPKNSIAIVTRVGVGKLAIIDQDYATSQDFLSLSDFNGDTQFIVYSIYRMLQKESAQLQGTSIKGITKEDLLSKKISIPESLEEQSAIGSLFRTLDDLLASYKNNLANYQSLKTTMLSKMFPKAGQTIPEIRLDGFEGEWVEKRLKDISKRVTRKNNDLVSERALTISAQFGLIDQEEFFQKKIASKDVSGYYLIKKGEFAYNKSYSTGYPLGAIKRLDKYENGVLSTLYILFKAVDVDSDYLAHYYESDKWHREVSMCAAEGARNHGLLNIAPADFFNTRLVIPKELEEQQAVGAYFSNLDNLINSYQEKITQLETLKKKLLQDMFI
ncbi:restriction endonuclease subunit S [Streptococcus parasanguinis]|mgnify:FL=1|uniref:restriction endonuclease subunit S n=1 Tax=Streptococcus parasanguinis TaxID=1318 RepID=UPI000E4DE4C7|nr:restriction endonuclease subunit S [Streptococcus parasanguinis]RHF68797.1 restriction endonuclease subunit S [Streptococcus parasanguinis]